MLLIFTIVYFLGMLFYYLGLNIVASVLIIALAIFLYVAEVINNKKIVCIKGFFGLGLIGGFGLSLLKLSNLSMSYNLMTFFVVYAAYFSLYLGTYFSTRNFVVKEIKAPQKTTFTKVENQSILFYLLLSATFLSFIIEVAILGFIPLFTSHTPHAYSTFHVFGLHYITTLYVFLPCLAICNFFYSKIKRVHQIVLAFIYSIIMSLLMVSRSQLIVSIVLSIFVVLIYEKEKIFSVFAKQQIIDLESKKHTRNMVLGCIGAIMCFIVLYIVITIYRAHDVTYLNSIFDMKNKDMPIFITQPYMYIAHNFENLNYLIEKVFRLTFGRRILYPFFTLTFIKKLFPVVVDSPLYVIKEELSTVTLVYDFYYDFGLVGVIIFCFIIGYIGKRIEDITYLRLRQNYFKKNNYIVILFSLYAYFMFFSFFQAYFSLTDTWVHFIFLIFITCMFKMTSIESKHNI